MIEQQSCADLENLQSEIEIKAESMLNTQYTLFKVRFHNSEVPTRAITCIIKQMKSSSCAKYII